MRKIFANLLFLFLGLPLALSALFLVAARPWALDRETYKRFVTDDRLYAALQSPELASKADREIVLKPRGSASSVSLDGPALIAAAQKDLPWQAIESTASLAIDAVFDAVGRRDGAALELDLRPLKASLKKSLPALARDYVTGAAAAGRSLPAELDSPAEVSAALGISLDAIPDSQRIEGPAPPAPGRRLPAAVLSRGPDALSQALLNRTTAAMAAASALLLAGLGALGGTSLLSRLSRGGRYLLLPSIVVLALGVALGIPGGLVLQNVLPREAQDLLGGAAGAQLRAYLAAALQPIAMSFFITGLVGASVGGVLAQAKRMAEPKELE